MFYLTFFGGVLSIFQCRVNGLYRTHKFLLGHFAEIPTDNCSTTDQWRREKVPIWVVSSAWTWSCKALLFWFDEQFRIVSSILCQTQSFVLRLLLGAFVQFVKLAVGLSFKELREVFLAVCSGNFELVGVGIGVTNKDFGADNEGLFWRWQRSDHEGFWSEQKCCWTLFWNNCSFSLVPKHVWDGFVVRWGFFFLQCWVVLDTHWFPELVGSTFCLSRHVLPPFSSKREEMLMRLSVKTVTDIKKQNTHKHEPQKIRFVSDPSPKVTTGCMKREIFSGLNNPEGWFGVFDLPFESSPAFWVFHFVFQVLPQMCQFLQSAPPIFVAHNAFERSPERCWHSSSRQESVIVVVLSPNKKTNPLHFHIFLSTTIARISLVPNQKRLIFHSRTTETKIYSIFPFAVLFLLLFFGKKVNSVLWAGWIALLEQRNILTSNTHNKKKSQREPTVCYHSEPFEPSWELQLSESLELLVSFFSDLWLFGSFCAIFRVFDCGVFGMLVCLFAEDTRLLHLHEKDHQPSPCETIQSSVGLFSMLCVFFVITITADNTLTKSAGSLAPTVKQTKTRRKPLFESVTLESRW